MNQERRIRNQICSKEAIGISEFKLGSENFLRKNDTAIATALPTRRRSSITMCTFDTNNSVGTMDSQHPSHNNDESVADSDALSFLRTQKRRSSLSSINIALSILTVGDCDELLDENIANQPTIALDNETRSKTFRRGAEILDENVLEQLAMALGDCDEAPAKPFRRPTNNAMEALDEKVLNELAIALGDCDETPAKPSRRPTDNGMEALDEKFLKELAIAMVDCDETPAKPFRRTTNDGTEVLDETVLKQLARALGDCDEAPEKPFRRPTNNAMEALDEKVLNELAIALGDETPSKPFRRITNDGIEALDESILKELAIALDNETPSKPFRRGAEILDENVLEQLAITLGDETPAKPFRRSTKDSIEALDESILKELAIALDNETPSKPFRRGAEILDRNVLKELTISLSDETPAKPLKRISIPDGTDVLNESIQKELAIVLDDEAPEKTFRRISTPDDVEELDESIQNELAIVLDNESPRKPFGRKPCRRLSSARKLQVKWPPISVASSTANTKASSNKAISSLSPKKSASATVLPVSPSSSEEKSALSSLSHSENLICGESLRKVIGRSLHAQTQQGIKEKIDLYENMCERSRETFNIHPLNCQDDFDCDLYPTMKIRATQFHIDNNTVHSIVDHEDSQAQLFVTRVIDVDGQCEESTFSSVPLDDENYYEQLEHISDVSHYEENNIFEASTAFDSECDASFISLVDYFDDSDASSASVSLATHNMDNSYQLSLEDKPGDHDKKEGKRFKIRLSWMSDSMEQHDHPLQTSSTELATNNQKTASVRFFHHNERDFGRPDEWVRPTDANKDCSGSSKCNHYNERGFGRPDEWLRPNDAYGEFSVSNDTYKESTDSSKCNHHNKRGFGRADEWVRSNDAHKESLDSSKSIKHNERGFGRPDVRVRSTDTYEESSKYRKSECDKRYHHDERGFHRPDEWVTPNTSYDGSLECRSSRSPVTSRTAKDRSARQSSPEEHSTHSSKKTGPPQPLTCAVTLDEYKNLEYLMETRSIVKDLMEARNVRMDYADGIEECRRKKYQKKKKIMKGKSKKARDKSSSQVTVSITSRTIKYDLDDGYKRGTPTWEKIALQQSEEEPNIKLWWEF